MRMPNKLWQEFLQSGDPRQYLKFKGVTKFNENDKGTGISDTRVDSRRE